MVSVKKSLIEIYNKVYLFMLYSEFSFSSKGGVLYMYSDILSPIGNASFALNFLYYVC